MKSALRSLAGLILFCLAATSHATLITTVNPTSDGSIYTCARCNNTVDNSAYVMTAGDMQGAIKFSAAAIDDSVSSVVLTLNPYGLPLFGQRVDIYGYGAATGALSGSDANAGVFLGTLVLPTNLGYGQDAYFDVTAFATSIAAPYLAFNLRSTGTNVFSSLEYNYGHPAQLRISSVPEPESLALMLAGLVAAVTIKRRSRGHSSAQPA